jgi:uncharacterized protein
MQFPNFLAGRIQTDRLTLPIQDLSPRHQGLRILQLSDLHYDGIQLSDRQLQETIQRSNQERPDLIVLTGDFITYQPHPIHKLIPQLNRLRSRYGTYAILGNHDLYHPTSRIVLTQAFENSDIKLLWNQIAYPFGPELPLIGLADYSHKAFDPTILNTLDPQIPRIVLSHNPDSASDLTPWRVDLQLSGHTHGGQIYIPGIGTLAALLSREFDHIPDILKRNLRILRTTKRVVKNWDWARGLHHIPTERPTPNLLYVNRGLGTYPPGRLWCPPEITVLTLMSP